MTASRRATETQSPNDVLFIADPNAQRSKVRTLAGVDGVVKRSLEAVRKDWKLIVDQVEGIIASTDQTAKAGYNLSEVTVSLGFTAEGKIAFIASAGVEASISLTFQKPD